MSWWGKHNKTIGTVAGVAGAALGAYALAPYLAGAGTAAAGTGAAAAGTGMTTGQALLASTALSGAATAYSTNKTNKANAEAIAAQNAYNAPAAQMARLQEAGLNPNLIYSSGNVVGNQSGAASYDYSGYGKAAGDALSSYLAIQNHDMDMQMKNQQLIQQEINNQISDASKLSVINKTVMEDKIAQANLRMTEAQARIAEHDADVTDKNPNTLSKNAGYSSILGVPLGQYIDRLAARPYWDNGKIKWK